MSDKVQTMAYVGETPWHGLGVTLDPGATIAQMRRAAGLTWEPVVIEQRFTFDGKQQVGPRPVMVRSDTGFVLDVVGPRYVPIKNEEVLDFFKEYCEAGELTLETAGVLDEGRYVWALAKMATGFALDRTDKTEGYVFLANPHQYGRGATAKFTAVRVVCWNTWQAALAGGSKGVKIWHVATFDKARRDDVQQEMGIARDRLAAFKADAVLLAGTRLRDEVARQLIARVFKREVKVAADWDAAPRAVRRVYDLYAGEGKGAKLVTAQSTAWGVFNAVTQYVDWEHGRTPDARLRASWFGYGGTLKQRALTLLTAHAGKKAA